MLIYDSMRVRDDLRETGDNVFWVKESDYNELRHQLESAKAERDNAREHCKKIWKPLNRITNIIDSMGDMSDRKICPAVWRNLDCENAVQTARAALAMYGEEGQ